MSDTNTALMRLSAAIATGTVALLASTSAWAAAQEPSISGDKWIAYAIIGGLIAAIVIFVLISVGIERRDEAYERGHKHHNTLPGLPLLGEEEDGED